jgi:uncharacterized membrane protein
MEMYKEHTVMGRHHELQRERVTNLILLISAALLAFAVNSKNLAALFPLGTLIAVLGLFGAIFSYKHYERFRLHTKIAGEFRDALEASLVGCKLREIRNSAVTAHEKIFPSSSKWRLHMFWVTLNLLVVLLGIVLAIRLIPISNA